MGVIWARTVAEAALVVACGLAPAGCEPAKEPGRSTVSLRLRGAPPDAVVIIDDEAVGALEFVGAHGVALPPGVHHVSVEARGYFAWDRELDAKEGSPPIALEVVLAPIPD